MNAHAAFGPLLRRWRTARGVTQERLAGAAEVSPRHLSFLENGRAAPSREMVLVLASALDLPLRERNAMLGAAGFAPVYRESGYDSAALAGVRRALGHLLRASEPYPAMVLDRVWNLRDLNAGATRLLGWLTGGAPLSTPNVIEALFDPAHGVRAHIANWHEVAADLLDRLEREVAAEPDDHALRALRDRVRGHGGVGVVAHVVARAADPLQPFVPVHFRRDGTDLRFFTTLTTLGTPLDVTAQDLRIETYFPADDATERFVRALADDAAAS